MLPCPNSVRPLDSQNPMLCQSIRALTASPNYTARSTVPLALTLTVTEAERSRLGSASVSAHWPVYILSHLPPCMNELQRLRIEWIACSRYGDAFAACLYNRVIVERITKALDQSPRAESTSLGELRLSKYYWWPLVERDKISDDRIKSGMGRKVNIYLIIDVLKQG